MFPERTEKCVRQIVFDWYLQHIMSSEKIIMAFKAISNLLCALYFFLVYIIVAQ